MGRNTVERAYRRGVEDGEKHRGESRQEKKEE